MVKHNPVRASRSRSNWCFMVLAISLSFITHWQQARKPYIYKGRAYATLKSTMKLLILYRPNSEHGRLIEEFIHDYQARHQSDRVEVMSLDTREGSATASLYDVVQYPAILVVQTDGYVQKIWQGEQLPLMDEVASYAAV